MTEVNNDTGAAVQQNVDVHSLSDAEFDNMFNAQRQDSETLTDSQEVSNAEEASRESGRNELSVQESSERSQLPANAAESSGEDGREVRESGEESADDESAETERHVTSYKAALKEERQRRQEQAQQLAELREQNKKMAEAFNKLVEVADSPRTTDQKPIPAYEEDPIGHLNAKIEALQRQNEELSKATNETRQQALDRQKYELFQQDYAAKTRQYSSSVPDYDAAKTHLIEAIKQDYIVQGLTEEQADKQARNDEITFAATQMSQGKNPAEIIYEMSKRRGYQSTAAKATAPKNNDADKISRMEKGIKASRSLNGKGESPHHRMTLEEIALLSDDDFEKVNWNDVLAMG